MRKTCRQMRNEPPKASEDDAAKVPYREEAERRFGMASRICRCVFYLCRIIS